jgi:hypothetical protein
MTLTLPYLYLDPSNGQNHQHTSLLWILRRVNQA